MAAKQKSKSPQTKTVTVKNGNTTHRHIKIISVPKQNNDTIIPASKPVDDNEIVTLKEWYSAGRPYRARSKEYFVNALLIATALEIIIYLIFKSFQLMTVVFSLVFLSFALALVPPHPFYYKITSEGIRIEDHFYIWEELYDFYFMKRHGQEVLHVRTKAFFPGELTITLGDNTVDDLKRTLIPYLPYREYVKPSFVDKASEWLEKNFPLEKTVS